MIMAVDKPVLGALRGLSFEVETAAYPQIASGGTTGDVWEKNDNQVKFRFTSAELRASFLVEAARIFRAGLFQLVSTDDADPATPRHTS
ncbi:hypothetical protein GCM10010199_48970 [Dactylosporangium roseum]